MKKERKEIEYEEAPSGFVYFYNYKEPLMKFDKGHGFLGTLAFDGDTDKIQCHLCGEWYGNLPPHLVKEHNIRAPAYKEIVGLNQTTALINENMRKKLIASGMDKRLQNLRQNGMGKGTTRSKEVRAKISATLKKNTPEMQNLRGTCPVQLIERLRNKYFELGRTPLHKELGFHNALTATYGTMKQACAIAGIPYRDCIEYIRNFFDINGRLPRHKDVGKNALWRNIQRYNYRELCRDALASDNHYRKPDKRLFYTKEQLINFVRNFETIHGRKPSYSDCKRGLLPHLSRYSYHFGSWQNTLKIAFK